MRFTGASLTLCLSLTLACTDDGSSATDEDTSTGDGDGDGDPTGDGDGDGDGDPELPPDFLAELTEVGGCGDVYIGATTPDGTLGVLFDGAPLAATAHMLGEPQVRESTLPSDDVELRIATGSDLDQGCNDAGPLPSVAQQWTAVSGTVVLTVTPTGVAEPWAVPADATLELSNVTFERDGLEPVTVDSWVFEDVSVGWFPG